MAEQTFIGADPVDSIPADKLAKPDDAELARKEARRDPAQQPGATTREGVATRDPAEYDTAGRGGQGNTQPRADPVI